MVSATIGLVAVVLASVTLVAILLIVPLVLVMGAEIRRLAVHRAESVVLARSEGGVANPVVLAVLREMGETTAPTAGATCWPRSSATPC